MPHRVVGLGVRRWDADPDGCLLVLSNGPVWVDYRHPALPVLIQPVVALVAGVLSRVGVARTTLILLAGLALLPKPPLGDAMLLMLAALTVADSTILRRAAFAALAAH